MPRKPRRQPQPLPTDPWGGPANPMMMQGPTNIGTPSMYISGHEEDAPLPNLPLSAQKIGQRKRTPSDNEAPGIAAQYAVGNMFDASNFGEPETTDDYAAFAASEQKRAVQTPVPPSRQLTRGYPGLKTTFGDNEAALIRTAKQAEMPSTRTVDKQIILADEEGVTDEEAELVRRGIYHPEHANRLATLIHMHTGIDLSGATRSEVYKKAIELGMEKHAGSYFPGKQIWETPTQQVDSAWVRKMLAANAASLLSPSETTMNPAYSGRPSGVYSGREIEDPRGYMLYAPDPYAVEKAEIPGWKDSAQTWEKSRAAAAAMAADPEGFAQKRQERLDRMKATSAKGRAAKAQEAAEPVAAEPEKKPVTKKQPANKQPANKKPSNKKPSNKKTG